MDTVYRISKTDLARKTHQVIREIQRGQTAIIENHGQAEAAILDIVDYYLLRAAASSVDLPSVSEMGEQASYANEQERYTQVLAGYLARRISLARAAELLALPVLDLRFRFVRLGLPLHFGPDSLDELQQDIQNALGAARGADE